VLSTVNELYTRNYAKRQGITHEQLLGESRKRLAVKVQQIKEYSLIHSNKPRIIEFGTRRRWSFEWQREMLQTLLAQLPDTIVGTSNFLLAKELCIRPVGTWGHEFAMGLQGIYPVQHSQREALKVWLREYRGAWGIALTDTLGTGKFLRDFSYELAKGYDGVRHDSGDPIAFTERIIDMYKKYGIDPKSKRLVFSDGLDIRTALDLQERFAERIQVSFGIGTNLTNDTGLIPVPQIVMKMIRSHGQPVVKLSDTPGKISCIDPLVAQYTQHIVDQFC
jgi:nicotinate phosphoribosyltransferase